MQRKTQTALAALMALGIAGGAAAQSAGVSADVGVGSDAKGSVSADVGVSGSGDVANSADTGASGSASGSVSGGKKMGDDMQASAAGDLRTYGELVSSLKTADTMATDLSGFDAGSTVSVTAVSELEGEGAENAAALDNAVAENQAAIEEMRAQITANADLSAALEAEGYTADDVIAAQANGDSSVTLYVNDTM